MRRGDKYFSKEVLGGYEHPINISEILHLFKMVQEIENKDDFILNRFSYQKAGTHEMPCRDGK